MSEPVSPDPTEDAPREDKTTPDFWTGRYHDGDSHWELGEPSPALEHALAAGLLEELGVASGDRVLVPGCGRGQDLLPFVRRGFEVVGVDFAAPAAAGAREMLSAQGLSATVIQADLFALGSEHDARYGLVFDHTCVCALSRDRQVRYAECLRRWLRPGGVFVHVAFPADPEKPYEEGPPFRMLRPDCEAIFAPHFEPIASRVPPVSHERRAGRERLDLWRRRD
jgi:SAM-dependent methyltransferase